MVCIPMVPNRWHRINEEGDMDSQRNQQQSSLMRIMTEILKNTRTHEE
jgi:hypothetical protein